MVHSLFEARVGLLQISESGSKVSSQANTGVVSRHHGRVIGFEEFLQAGILVGFLVLLGKPLKIENVDVTHLVLVVCPFCFSAEPRLYGHKIV